MEIFWSRSATRHRVSRRRSEHVVRAATAVFREPAPAGSAAQDERLVFLGADLDGTLLEVMAVETDCGLLVIHAMAMRAKYVPYLEEADDD